METQRRDDRRAGPAWVIRRSDESQAEVAAQVERLKQELESHRENAVDWEASVLDNVANLLDTMGRARVDWESLRAELTSVRANLETAQEARDELVELTGERDRLREANAELEERVAGLLRELEAARERTADLERERAEAAEALARRTALEADLDETRMRLEAALRERDVLLEERAALESSRADLAEARERVAALERESEQSLVHICELRGRINRIEEERDEAVKAGKRKFRKVLAKIHEELDGIGAPKGADLSFGERIRRLKG